MTLLKPVSRYLSIPTGFLLLLTVALPTAAQESSGLHISPILINVGVGEGQPLQVLDANGNELTSSGWSVDSPDLAEIKQESGQIVLFPKAAGAVHVLTSVEGTTLTAEIKIWLLEPRMIIAGPHWVVPSTGRQLAALQAAPAPDGPDLFTLDQNDKGTYVRGFTNRGMQMWMWRLPEAVGKAELMCGDNMGGAVLTVTRPNAYSLYVVGKDGKLKWRHTFEGVRKGYALNASNFIHLLNQSVDGTSAVLSAWDGSSGVEKFTLKVPPSYEYDVNLRKSGDNFICTQGRSTSRPLRPETSGLFVNTDGDAYATFTVKHRTSGIDTCMAGSVVEPQKIYFSSDDQLVLWRIQSDGSHRDTVVETSKQSRLPLAASITDESPTGDIIPDGFGGVLFSIRRTSNTPQKTERVVNEFVYRVTQDGELAYKFPLPKYAGKLRDEMVLGEQELGFATRGGMLIAFNVRDGNEVWRWNSGIPAVKINMATAGGGCVVDTPEGLALIEEGVKKQVIAPPGSEMYTPGLFIQDDPHGLAMLGAGITPD